MSQVKIDPPYDLPSTVPKIGRAVLLLVGLNVVFFALLAWMYGTGTVAAEDGPMENLQVAVLLLAMIVFLLASIRHRAAARMLCFGLAVFTVVLVLREYEPTGTGPIMAYMRSHRFRWHETYVVVAIAVVYMLARWRCVPVIARYFLNKGSIYFYLAALFVVCSAGFEKMHIEFFEELLESNGYIVHCLMAIVWLVRIPPKRSSS